MKLWGEEIHTQTHAEEHDGERSSRGHMERGGRRGYPAANGMPASHGTPPTAASPHITPPASTRRQPLEHPTHLLCRGGGGGNGGGVEGHGTPWGNKGTQPREMGLLHTPRPPRVVKFEVKSLAGWNKNYARCHPGSFFSFIPFSPCGARCDASRRPPWPRCEGLGGQRLRACIPLWAGGTAVHWRCT